VVRHDRKRACLGTHSLDPALPGRSPKM